MWLHQLSDIFANLAKEMLEDVQKLKELQTPTLHEAKDRYELLIAWHEAAEVVCDRMIYSLTREGFEVEGADRLAEAKQEINSWIPELKGRVDGLGEALDGNGIRFTDFVEGLRTI